MGPGWRHVLRFDDGARLRIDCVLPKALRGTIAQSSRRAAAWLDAVDGATLSVLRITPDACELRCEAASLAALSLQLRGHRDADAPTHRVHVEIAGAAGALADAPLELAGIALQSGGRADAYIARDTETGRQQLAHLAYDGDGTASLVLFGAAFAAHVPAHLRALVPSRLAVARLVPLAG